MAILTALLKMMGIPNDVKIRSLVRINLYCLGTVLPNRDGQWAGGIYFQFSLLSLLPTSKREGRYKMFARREFHFNPLLEAAFDGIFAMREGAHFSYKYDRGI